MYGLYLNSPVWLAAILAACQFVDFIRKFAVVLPVVVQLPQLLALSLSFALRLARNLVNASRERLG